MPVTLKKEDNIICSHFDISNRQNNVRPEAETYTQIFKGQTEYFEKEDVEMLVSYFMDKGAITNAVLLIMGFNTGYRCKDLLDLWVRSCFHEVNGELVVNDYVTINESKTKNVVTKTPRTVWLNKAVKESLTWLVRTKGLTMEDSLFCPDKTQNQQRAEDGHLKPLKRDSVCKFIQRATKELDIKGFFGSHSMRKTYAHYMALVTPDEEQLNLTMACAALGHSNPTITEKHYLTISDSKLRAKTLSLNLGYDGWKAYI